VPRWGAAAAIVAAAHAGAAGVAVEWSPAEVGHGRSITLIVPIRFDR
jgi:hypothetical protein